MTNDGLAPEPPSGAPDWEALARLSTGESSAEEAQRLSHWLEKHPEDAQAFALVNQAAKSLAFAPPSDVDVSSALDRVKTRLEEPAERQRRLPMARYASSRRARWITPLVSALAAAIVAIVLTSRGSRVSSVASPPAVAPAEPAPRVYTTAVGRRDSVRLPDGSRIVLGPDTRLTVPTDYGRSRRAIELQGVAYLDVKHDAAMPFSVRDGGALIDDIGTEFTIHDDLDGTVTVAVKNGQVRLRTVVGDSASGVVLAAGDRGVLDAGGRALAYRSSVDDDDLAWMHGVLVLRDAPLTRVATELRRWYGIDLRPDSALAQRHVTTTFSGAPRDTVLRVIGLILGARVEERGDTSILHATHGRSPPR